MPPVAHIPCPMGGYVLSLWVHAQTVSVLDSIEEAEEELL